MTRNSAPAISLIVALLSATGLPVFAEDTAADSANESLPRILITFDVGESRKLSNAPAPVKQAYLLKNLNNIPQWIGILVHESIKFAMARLKAGQPVATEDLIKQMKRRAKVDLEDSQSGRYVQKPNQMIGFQEHYYQIGVSGSAWKRLKLKPSNICVRL